MNLGSSHSSKSGNGYDNQFMNLQVVDRTQSYIPHYAIYLMFDQIKISLTKFTT